MPDHQVLNAINDLRDTVTSGQTATIARLTTLETLLMPPRGRSLPERVESLEKWNYKASGALGLLVLGFEGLTHWLGSKH